MSVSADNASYQQWSRRGLYKSNGLLVLGDAIAQIVGAGVVVVGIAQFLPLWPLLIWWLSVAGLAIGYCSLTRRRLSMASQDWQVERWLKHYLLYRLLVGVLWAFPAASLYFSPESLPLLLWVSMAYILVILTLTLINLVPGTVPISLAPVVLTFLVTAYFVGSVQIAGVGFGVVALACLATPITVAIRRWVKHTVRLDFQRHNAVKELLKNTEEQRALIKTTAADKERLELLAQNSTDIIAMHADSGRYLYVNDTVEEVLGYKPTDMVGTVPLDYVHPEDQKRVIAAHRLSQANRGKCFIPEFRMRHRQGHYVWVEVFERALEKTPQSHSGIRTVTVARDVTERHKMEVDVAIQRQTLEMSLRSIADAVLTVDANAQVLYANAAAEGIAGNRAWNGSPVCDWLRLKLPQCNSDFVWNPNQATQKTPVICLQVETQRYFEITCQQLQSDLDIPGLEAPLAAELLQANPLHQGYVLVLRDITERLALEKQLRLKAETDNLSGLFNRGAFEERLEATYQALQCSGGSHALVFADLDQFKVVNDTAGHAAGDVLIREIGKALAAAVREGDFVARLGGDEFALLLMDCQAGDARRRCQQVCDAVSQIDFEWEGRRFPVGASFGVAMLDRSVASTELAMGRADAACYVVKDRGRRGVHLWSADSADSGRQASDMNWVSRLQSALKEHRILIYGQQIWSLSSQKAHHVEVLISLREVDGTIASPNEFIPAAERYGLMPAIDHYVMTAVFKHMAPLQAELLAANYRIAINLSGHTIGSDKALDEIRKLFHRHAIDPRLICFEITETTALQNVADAQRFLQTLKEMGCQLALDDFGTGFSSFSYLKSLPVDMLKIDGEFVREMLHSETDHSIVESIHRVGRTMGLETVAECVESADIEKELVAIGVDYGQGVFLSQRRPLREILNRNTAL